GRAFGAWKILNQARWCWGQVDPVTRPGRVITDRERASSPVLSCVCQLRYSGVPSHTDAIAGTPAVTDQKTCYPSLKIVTGWFCRSFDFFCRSLPVQKWELNRSMVGSKLLLRAVETDREPSMQNLQEVVDFLKRNNLVLATAESCTAGLIASLVADVSGSGAVMECGYVVYAVRAKREMLGVNLETIDRFGLTKIGRA